MRLKDFKLERFFARYEFNTPFLLCTSDCESFSVEELLDLEEDAEKNLKQLRLGYTESLGNPELREEISRLYTGTTADDIIVLAGAEEGIFIFMNVLLEPGDQVIVQSPCYQSLYEVANAVGCRVTEWFMDPQKNWELDIGFLEKNITRHTKAIIVNFPNNPTGYTVPKEMFNEIIEIAKRQNIFLFSDEVYRFLEYDEEDRLPAGCDMYERGISLGVMSKSFGLPGLRIGWLVVKDRDLFKKIASFKDFTTICSSAPGEFLAGLALRNREHLLNRNLGIIRTNLRYLESFFERYADFFEWVKPKAGPLIFPRLKIDRGSEAFCLDVLNKKGVLLVPGNIFNYDRGHVRIGFGRRSMPEALAKLEEYLKDF
jgi:aspartate/methionine/tyrosine aminotransferase